MKLQHALLASLAACAVLYSPVRADDDNGITALAASGTDDADFDFGSGSAEPWGSQDEDFDFGSGSADPWGSQSEDFGDSSNSSEGSNGAESDENEHADDGGVDSSNTGITRRLREMANTTATNSTKPAATPAKKSAANTPVSITGGVMVASAALTTLLAL